MQRGVYLREKIIERQTRTTIVALVVHIILDGIDVSPCLVLLLL